MTSGTIFRDQHTGDAYHALPTQELLAIEAELAKILGVLASHGFDDEIPDLDYVEELTPNQIKAINDHSIYDWE